jgi:hypothetical protein
MIQWEREGESEGSVHCKALGVYILEHGGIVSVLEERVTYWKFSGSIAFRTFSWLRVRGGRASQHASSSDGIA